MFGGAGFAGYMVALFLSLTELFALAHVKGAGWAALLVTGVWAVTGAVLFTLGRSRMRSVSPERTVQTVKELAQWARHPTGEGPTSKGPATNCPATSISWRIAPALAAWHAAAPNGFAQRPQGFRERIMGAAVDVPGQARSVQESASQAADTVRQTAEEAGETVRRVPEQAVRRTQGNLLAAGLIAFGAGLLAASLLPVSQAEQQAAAELSTRPSRRSSR
ncbi:phage holin family protein [Streptomyces sp. KLMMK]|uniref:phage holin family protein n=1 Tax=Streptomyces sp. KLMMK TaxID=3109353 RepID=UPI002FFD7CE9